MEAYNFQLMSEDVRMEEVRKSGAQDRWVQRQIATS
jgi:hypothetical protein